MSWWAGMSRAAFTAEARRRDAERIRKGGRIVKRHFSSAAPSVGLKSHPTVAAVRAGKPYGGRVIR